MQTQFSDENEFDQELTEDVERFLARFSSWIDVDATASAKKSKAAVDSLGRLVAETNALQQRVRDGSERIDRRLAATFWSASGQVPSLLDEWRVRLGVVAPGAPRSSVDLDTLQARLQEREARQELGVSALPQTIRAHTGTASVASALGIGIFALGWNGFTLVHAIFMIGGMMKSFGPIALLLVFFYSIFFGVGAVMVLATIAALSDEDVDLDGRTLTIMTKFFGRVKRKVYTLPDWAKAEIGKPVSNETAMGSNNNGNRLMSIVVPTTTGKPVSFGSRLLPQERQMLMQKINGYLAALPPSLT